MTPLGFLFEPVSSLSHLLAAVVALAAAPALLRQAGGHRSSQLAVGVYTFCLVFLLAASGLYHGQFESPGRFFLQRLDHAGIWLLIAGSFTPPHVMLFRGRWRWLVLTVVWTVALAGVAFKLALPINSLPAGLNVALYVGLSLLGVASVVRLMRHHGARTVWPLFVCGAVYLAGAMCFLFHIPGALLPGVFGHHELWHLAVIAGAASHWLWVYQITGRRLDLAIEPRLAPASDLSSALRPALSPA